MEIWKDIPGYEGVYKVSNIGNVKSIDRISTNSKFTRKLNGITLAQYLNPQGYFSVNLQKGIRQYPRSVHQLVAEAFLGFKQNGNTLVVNHINLIKTDNRLVNLEITTMRNNSNKKHIPHTSKYTGVSWNKNIKKWNAKTYKDKKLVHLGYFSNEKEASDVYQSFIKKSLTLILILISFAAYGQSGTFKLSNVSTSKQWVGTYYCMKIDPTVDSTKVQSLKCTMIKRDSIQTLIQVWVGANGKEFARKDDTGKWIFKDPEKAMDLLVFMLYGKYYGQ